MEMDAFLCCIGSCSADMAGCKLVEEVKQGPP